MLTYVDIPELIAADGLRLVLLRGYPSPWGQAAKAMMEYKRLDFTVGALQAGGENADVVSWAGTNSAPVVAWQDEAPINRWDDILLLLERLAPDRPLVPSSPAERAECFGLAYLICAPLGFGWNYRLIGAQARIEAGKPMGLMGEKYGYNPTDGPLAEERVVGFLDHLAARLHAQAAAGSGYLIGDSVTAVDFYWAAFSNLLQIQSAEECPLDPAIRAIFEIVPPALARADKILIEHRDRIMRTYFKIPMEL